jgi:hypothetical protein
MNVRPEILLIAGGAVLAALLIAGKNAGAVGEGIGAAAVDMADGVISGTVFAVGDKLGIERTDAQMGEAALSNGNYWEASFLLPAGDFIAGSWRRLTN